MIHDTDDTYYTDDALDSMVDEDLSKLMAKRTMDGMGLKESMIFETYKGQERGSFPELKPIDYDDPNLGKDNVLTVELLDRASRELTSLSVEQGPTLGQLDAAFDIVKR